MTDIDQQALDLLCGECDLDPEDYCPGLRIDAEEALRAVAAALRATRERYFMAPSEPAAWKYRAPGKNFWRVTLDSRINPEWERIPLYAAQTATIATVRPPGDLRTELGES